MKWLTLSLMLVVLFSGCVVQEDYFTKVNRLESKLNRSFDELTYVISDGNESATFIDRMNIMGDPANKLKIEVVLNKTLKDLEEYYLFLNESEEFAIENDPLYEWRWNYSSEMSFSLLAVGFFDFGFNVVGFGQLGESISNRSTSNDLDSMLAILEEAQNEN